MKGARRVYIVIGCDTDPDRAGFLEGVTPERLSWRGLTEGIPAVKRAVQGVKDAAGKEPVFTWLLRADEQLRRMQGDYAWAAHTHTALLQSLRDGGDELGWHPHFWRRESGRDPWFQELMDVDWQVEMLRQAHAALAASPAGPPRSVRMGWTYHNNRTYATLESLGIEVEFSAFPGLRTLTPHPDLRGENLFDWFDTPRAPYRPARDDYRRPPRNGEAASTLLQAPCFVSTAALWGVASGLQLARKMRSPGRLFDAIRRPRYVINLTGRTALFAPLVAQLERDLRSGSGAVVFATCFHPDELLPNRSSLYSLASVRANLTTLLHACERAGAATAFIPARDIPRAVGSA